MAVETMVETEEGLVKKMTSFKSRPSFKEIMAPAGVILLIIFAGGLTGYFLARRGGVGGRAGTKELMGGAKLVQGPQEVGIQDVKTFRDTAEGRLEVNDNSDVPEGSHRLVRPGGASQIAYLTSSVVDLDQFAGQCVQVWGETFAGQKAGWLMDVGRVKILTSCPEGL